MAEKRSNDSFEGKIFDQHPNRQLPVWPPQRLACHRGSTGALQRLDLELRLTLGCLYARLGPEGFLHCLLDGKLDYSDEVIATVPLYI
ncbi:unnamed protein product [Protopolystoma xenopodis]|uniref:Uncharacterized protein n=1 Tax=Protopolystoma xenopodis TaxID=117903 RepID=A0A448X7U1_9PLAT|nr:unnamed protein product [Protopolystoma xenopodis]